MNWLIWREYRQNRLIVFFGLGLLLLPYVLFLAMSAWERLVLFRPLDAWDITERLILAALFSIISCQLLVALIGGNSIAGERADRSAEFIAYLPISRTRLVIAKVALAAAATAIIWIPNVLVLILLCTYMPLPATDLLRDWGNVASQLAVTATVGFVFYGVAWFLSSLLDSPTSAVCGGLVTPLLVVFALGILDHMFVAHGIHLRIAMINSVGDSIFIGICIVLGISGFAIGTWHYVRRVEP